MHMYEMFMLTGLPNHVKLMDHMDLKINNKANHQMHFICTLKEKDLVPILCNN